MKLAIAFIGILFILSAFAVIFFSVNRQVVPEWMLQYTYYALMTAIFGFIFLGILAPLFKEYLEERKEKRAYKLTALELLHGEYAHCARLIGENLDNYVKKSKMANLVARLEPRNDFGEEIEVSKELKERVEEYNEKLKNYNLFFKMSERAIVELTEKRIRQMFPKTLRRYSELPTVLTADMFMDRYLNEEKVTTNWLRDTTPVALKNITKEIDETERHELDIYFNDINKLLKKEEVLQRFLKAKKELIEHGQNTIKALQDEAKTIDKQLQKSSHLRIPPSYEEDDRIE